MDNEREGEIKDEDMSVWLEQLSECDLSNWIGKDMGKNTWKFKIYYVLCEIFMGRGGMGIIQYRV